MRKGIGVKGKFGFEHQGKRLLHLGPRAEGEGPVPEQRGPGGQAYAHVVRAFQARRGQPVEQGAEAGGHGLRRQIGAGDVVQIRNIAAFQPDAAQRAREFSPGLEDDEAVLGDHNALRSGLHVKGGTSEGIPDAYPDFAFVFEGLERPFRHEFLPYLFKRDAQGGLHVHAAGGEIARNEGDLPLDGARKHGTPHGELMQGQPIPFPLCLPACPSGNS